ncbi:MAG: ribonuclease III [Hyphomonadaceae bacterium]|nr:ribonuclease III [Hyphomonadaceae bacterium]
MDAADRLPRRALPEAGELTLARAKKPADNTNDDRLAALQARAGYVFQDRALAHEALRHSSVLEGKKDRRSNERLEFFGDRVLNLVMAERLWEAFPEADEAELAQRFNALVNRTACARAARAADLGAALALSPSEERGGGRNKETILADACEALIAALYLDGGMQAARAFIETFFAEDFDAVVEASPRDPKSALQELAAAKKRDLKYVLVERTGPEHAPRFVVEAHMHGYKPAKGEGGAKREAERAAATALLKRLRHV